MGRAFPLRPAWWISAAGHRGSSTPCWRGHDDLTVVDVSDAALRITQDRLGGDAAEVHWVNADIGRGRLAGSSTCGMTARSCISSMSRPIRTPTGTRSTQPAGRAASRCSAALQPTDHALLWTSGRAARRRGSGGIPRATVDAGRAGPGDAPDARRCPSRSRGRRLSAGSEAVDTYQGAEPRNPTISDRLHDAERAAVPTNSSRKASATQPHWQHAAGCPPSRCADHPALRAVDRARRRSWRCRKSAVPSPPGMRTCRGRNAIIGSSSWRVGGVVNGCF